MSYSNDALFQLIEDALSDIMSNENGKTDDTVRDIRFDMIDLLLDNGTSTDYDILLEKGMSRLFKAWRSDPILSRGVLESTFRHNVRRTLGPGYAIYDTVLTSKLQETCVIVHPTADMPDLSHGMLHGLDEICPPHMPGGTYRDLLSDAVLLALRQVTFDAAYENDRHECVRFWCETTDDMTVLNIGFEK